MDIAEWEEVIECADCREPVADPTQGFAFGEDAALCLECATLRGGKYDAATDKWLVEPNLEGLETALAPFHADRWAVS